MDLGRSGAKVQMQPDTGVTFADVVGVDGAKIELEEVVQFLKESDRNSLRLVLVFPAVSSWRALLELARLSSLALLLARLVCPSSPYLALSSLRCSLVSAPPACVICSHRPRRMRPASSSLTKSTLSAASVAPALLVATTSASRPLTRSLPKWMASRAIRASSSLLPPIALTCSIRHCSAPAVLIGVSLLTCRTSRAV
eukprot:13604_6